MAITSMLDFTASFLYLFTVSVTLAFFIFHLLSEFSHRPKTPCPQAYPIIGNLPGFLCNHRRFHDWVTDMLSDSPSSTIHVKTFLNISRGVCTADPRNIQHLLSSNFSNYVKGSRFYSVLEELLGGGIFNVDGHPWNTQRKIASHEFTTNSLKRFISETVRSEVPNRLMPLLYRACEEDQVIDLQEVLQKFSFDNICNVAFGVDPACLDSKKSGENLSFSGAFDYAVQTSSSRILSPFPLLWKLKRFFGIGSEKKLKEAITVINDFATEIITQKEKEIQRESQDLLSRFMYSSSSKIEFGNEEEKRKFLRDIVISFVLAGRDTASTALAWFFWLLAGHPRCAASIRAELAAASDSSYDELKKLHYLHAALSESLRLFPPVPINTRLTVDDDVLPDGTEVRRGWFADYSAYAVGRMEKVWGSDCREFKPERWLDSKGVFQPSDSFRFPVFHAGPRTCLGKEMAYVQMKFIVAAVMSEFEVVVVDGGATMEKMMNPPYTISLLLKMRGGLPVKLRTLEKLV